MDFVELENEAPAIKALGSLFKLTEVFLWDSVSMDTREGLSFPELIKTNQHDDLSSDAVLKKTGSRDLPVDVELARQMNELGLPLSFHTNKQKRNVTIKGKRKNTNKKHLHVHEGFADGTKDVNKVSKGEIASPTVFHENTSNSLCSMSMMGQIESSYCNVAVDVNNIQSPSGEGEDSESYLIDDGLDHCEIKQGGESTAENGSSYYNVAVDVNNIQSPSGEGEDSESSLIDDGLDHCKIEQDGESTAENGSSYCNVAVDVNNIQSRSGEGEDSESYLIDDGLDHCKIKQDGESTAENGLDCEKFNSDIWVELSRVPDEFEYSQSLEALDRDELSSSCNGDFGDWRTYWDSFYKRNYFYNSKTQESTWDPPPSMEHLAFGDSTSRPEELIDFCDSQYYSESFEKSKNDDRSVDQWPSEPSDGFELAAANFNSSMTVSTISCRLEYLNGQQISRSRSDENSLYSSSVPQEHMESLISPFSTVVSEDNGNSNMQLEYLDPASDKLATEHDSVTTKQKKKVRRTRPNRKLYNGNEGK